jgi:ceramide glucosyltransferase
VTAVTWLLFALLIGSWVYLILILVASWRFLASSSFAGGELDRHAPSISILKPLAGLDEGLEINLRTFFKQVYPAGFEILFAVRTETDPAVAVVRRLQAEFSRVPSTLLFTGEPPYPNAKVFSLAKMTAAASNDLLVMSDSDMRVDPLMLQAVAADFANDPKMGIATCPYRAIAGASIWSRLEAVGMNTEFFGGVLVARMLEGMKFALGPTIVARKRCLEEIGGFDRLKDYLAEDFVMGKFADEAGWGVMLSRYVVEHRIGSESWAKNAAHRLRWARSTRASRPAGYVGQLFTNPMPISLALFLVAPAAWWPQVLVTLVLRGVAAWVVARVVLGAPVGWILLVPQDLLSFVFWTAGFFGNSIAWRGRRYRLNKDGTFTLMQHSSRAPLH